ncbi:hypothetical protein M569_10075, partial [Genlisea aurea]
MKLVLEILTGPLFHIRVDENTTVGELKKEIGKQQNLPDDRLILVLDVHHHPQPLMVRDEAPLQEYGVEDGSHVYVYFKPPNNAAVAAADVPKTPLPNAPPTP